MTSGGLKQEGAGERLSQNSTRRPIVGVFLDHRGGTMALDLYTEAGVGLAKHVREALEA